MTWRDLFRATIVFVLCMTLAMPAYAQTGAGKIVSTGKIVGAIVGIVAGLALVVLIVYLSVHKTSIKGCVQSDAQGLSLIREEDKKAYALSGSTGNLKAGERVGLNGKKGKDASGRLTFQVQKVANDYGACKP